MLAESGSRLDVQDVACGGEHRLVLAGELDLASASHLEKIARQICRAKPRRVVLDLRKLTFLDSTGIGVILALSKACRESRFSGSSRWAARMAYRPSLGQGASGNFLRKRRAHGSPPSGPVRLSVAMSSANA